MCSQLCPFGTLLFTLGLLREIAIKVHARVMLTANLDVSNGLVNGLDGRVAYMNEDMVGFTYTDNKRVTRTVDIPRIKRTVYGPISDEVVVEREQFPLELAYARTYHKLQSLTLTCKLEAKFPLTLHNLSLKRKLLYVLISRVKEIAQLKIANLPQPGTLRSIIDSDLAERTALYVKLGELDILKNVV